MKTERAGELQLDQKDSGRHYVLRGETESLLLFFWHSIIV